MINACIRWQTRCLLLPQYLCPRLGSRADTPDENAGAAHQLAQLLLGHFLGSKSRVFTQITMKNAAQSQSSHLCLYFRGLDPTRAVAGAALKMHHKLLDAEEWLI